MDGRPNRRNKDAFSNFSGLVLTSPYMEQAIVAPHSLFQALGQWGLSNAAGRRATCDEQIPLVPRPLRSTPQTESLEQAKLLIVHYPKITRLNLH